MLKLYNQWGKKKFININFIFLQKINNIIIEKIL